MRYLLLASHGKLAEGILDSTEMITGKHDNVFTISAYKHEEDDLNRQLESVMVQINHDDELIIVTDIFGGSVNNECMKLLDDTRIHLIAGLNLALVIELVTQMNFKITTDELIHTSIKNAKDAMLYCNQVIQDVPTNEDF
ncbi:hypothetical protein ABRT01_11705 [Lentibacillus sp. L22]|uniref:PTS sugar transporter subunit IIA n=1 Tax=Lentibacillus TaxID=175304 RepID=UPI0022B0EFF7|nr:hypothetical protein [Lentibacillus daqui]